MFSCGNFSAKKQHSNKVLPFVARWVEGPIIMPHHVYVPQAAVKTQKVAGNPDVAGETFYAGTEPPDAMVEFIIHRFIYLLI